MSTRNTSEKDFLSDLADLARELRNEIQAHQVGLDPSPAARLARRRRVLVEGVKKYLKSCPPPSQYCKV